MPTRIHSSAIVDAGATLGEGTAVWHFAHICAVTTAPAPTKA
jgi:UDP-2-acetamido-3-amino-2,3-dideoxy-glucuronate N-acetyltransferase